MAALTGLVVVCIFLLLLFLKRFFVTEFLETVADRNTKFLHRLGLSFLDVLSLFGGSGDLSGHVTYEYVFLTNQAILH